MSRRKKRRPEAALFGSTIRRLREARGLTQEQLAEQAEMNVSYVGFIERGDNVPTLTIIIQLADALKAIPRICYEK